MAKLTAKQKDALKAIDSPLRKQTALEYIELGYENGTRAYINACDFLGRKPSKNPETSASEILSYPNVKAFIDAVFEESAEKAGITSDWVLNGIKELTDSLITTDDAKAAYKGYELAGKHLKLFTDNVDHSSSDGSMSNNWTVEFVNADPKD